MSLRSLVLVLTLVAAARMAAAQGAAVSPAPVPAPRVEDEGARKARALLNQAVQALGGSAYLDYQTMEQEGRSYGFYHGAPNTLGTLYWLFWKSPESERLELTKQRDIVYVYQGDKGYEITYKGTRAAEEDEMKDYLRQREFSLTNLLRHWLNDPSVILFNEGRAFVDSKPADQVTLMNSKNQAVTLCLDQFSHLPIKKSYTVRDPVSRFHDEESEVYDNYHLVQGINTPYSLVRYHNGEMTRQRFITSVRYGGEISDSLFQASVNYDPNAKKKK